MSLQEIKIGNFANDGTGDDLREAFRKVNLNFQELDLRDDESTTAVNIGSTGEGIFAQKAGAELQFKKLAAGKDITLTSNNDRILIDANGGVKSLLVVSDSGSVMLQETAHINVFGGADISTRISSNSLIIDYNGTTNLASDPNPLLNENLNANGFNILNVVDVDADRLLGNLTGNVIAQDNTVIVNAQTKSINLSSTPISAHSNVDDKTAMVGNVLKWNGSRWTPTAIDLESNNFDFNGFSYTVTTILDYLAVQTDVDMGTFLDPSPISIDLGNL